MHLRESVQEGKGSGRGRNDVQYSNMKLSKKRKQI